MRGKLHVFLHTALDSRALQKKLGRELPGVDVVVFGRSRDFQRGVASSPEAVLCRSPVLAALGLTAGLQGVRSGKHHEPLVLLSEKNVEPRSFASVGVVDILGRRQMATFVRNALGGASPKVVPVTKLIDLVPLLQFDRAEAVLLPRRYVDELRSRTRLGLSVVDLPGAVIGLPAVAFPSGESTQRAKIQAMDSRLTRELGVEDWR